MIKLDVVYDRQLRQIVHELGALVEIGCVVFITFDDEVFTIADAKTDTKILGDPSNEKTRIQPAQLRDPGRNARGGCFAMRAGHHQRATTAYEFLFHDLRLRAIHEPPVKGLLHLGISAWDGIAYHDAVRRRFQVFSQIALENIDAKGLKHGGHWRIDILV